MRATGANLILMLSVLVVLGFAVLAFSMFETQAVKFSDFKQMVEQGQVESVTFQGQKVTAVKRGEANEARPQTVETVAVPGDTSLVSLLQAKNVPYGAEQEAGCGGSMLLMALMTSMVLYFVLV